LKEPVIGPDYDEKEEELDDIEKDILAFCSKDDTNCA